jgi:hypothetical protein
MEELILRIYRDENDVNNNQFNQSINQKKDNNPLEI